MAEITCCTGQTECNHIITIGYLKAFVGTNIKDSNGNTVSVNTSKNDSYVPTYSELTGGTLLPLFSDGGNNKWHSNIDGITINGTYTAGQGVEQTDLVLTYTRFKSLSISAGKTSFSECGDNTNICATYKFTKTVKAMNNCIAEESSSEGSDTTCKPSFSASSTWLSVGSCSNNCVNVSASKNGSWAANSRSCNVVAKVTYKGQQYSSNTVTITQNALTGSYSVYEGKHYTKTEITSHSPLTTTTCDSLTVTASATATYYNRYKWKDSCNQIYEYSYDDRYGTESAGSGSHTFPAVLCPTESEENSYKMTITYQGHSDSVTFYQVCSRSCPECSDFTTYGSCSDTESVGDCGGNVTVSCRMPATIHHKGWVNGVCVETSTTETSYTQSAIVSIGENPTQSAKTHSGSITTAEGGTINYTINQAAGPCGGCGQETTTYTYADVNVNCSAHTDEQTTVSYTAYTTYSVAACSPTSGTGTIGVTINIACNNTSSTRDYTIEGPFGGNFVVHQAAGPCCGCVPGVTWDVKPTKIPCDEVPIDGHFNTNIDKTEVYIDGGICKISSDTMTDVHIWNDAPGISIPANTTDNDKTLYIDIYYDGHDYFTTAAAAGGGPKIGTCTVTQIKCASTCVPGTDNAEDESTGQRHPFHLSCTDMGLTSDHYLGAWNLADQHVYGRNQSTGEKKNVNSYADSGSISNWGDYVTFLDADACYSQASLTNSYGFKAKKANDTGEDIWVRVTHQLISSETSPLPDTCSVWYSWLDFYACNTNSYTVNSNVEGATVNFYSNTSSNVHYGSRTISNGTCYMNIKYDNIRVVISKTNCTFSPNEATMTDGGTVTLNGSCSTPVTSCTGGSTSGGLTVAAAASSSKQQLGSWSKQPAGCSNSWSVDTSRSVTATNGTFIDTSSIEFRSDGSIWGTVNSTNTNNFARSCQIPTKLGSIADYFTVNQAAGSTPTTQCSSGVLTPTGSCLPAVASSTRLTIGTWNKTPSNCTDSWQIINPSAAVFLGNITFDNDGYIRAVVSSNNTSQYVRGISLQASLGSYTAFLGPINQCAGPVCEADTNVTYNITTTSLSNASGVNVVIGYIHYDCINFDINKLSASINGGSWITSIFFPSASSGSVPIVIHYSANGTGKQRTIEITIDYDSSTIGGWFTITQQA